MKASSLFFIFFIVVAISCSSRKEPLAEISEYLLAQTDSLIVQTDEMVMAIEAADYKTAKEAFINSRFHYKRLEGIVEFYFPGMAKALNGPALDKVEESDDKIIEATGFQVVEEYLFPVVDSVNREDLLKDAKNHRSSLTRLQQQFETSQMNDQNIFDALQLQLVRIASLGLSGFDSPVALQSIEEAVHALNAIEDITAAYGKSPEWKRLSIAVDDANKNLSGKDFNLFDRALFFRKYLKDVSANLIQVRKTLNIEWNTLPSAVDLTFSDVTLNVGFFAPLGSMDTPEMVGLGKILFFDPILSGNGKRSCASCHKPDNAFTDGKVKSMAFNFDGTLNRNTPTVINAGFQRAQFWDARVQYLEDQVTDVMTNPTEMHGEFSAASSKLNSSKEYRAAFYLAFGDSVISSQPIQKAVASYVRSLGALNSRFDRYIAGEETAMQDLELKGFNVFMGKAKCGICHFYPLFNGTVPPFYTESESEVIGVPSIVDTVRATIDPDEGRNKIVGHELHRFMFKTPTVRNAALTAPYMHNGVYRTLEEVIDFYNRGGGSGIGILLDNQTLPVDKLALTPTEKSQLIAFLNTLTDTTGITARPARLPLIDGVSQKERKIGGDY